MHAHIIYNVYYISSRGRKGVGNFQCVGELFSPLRQTKYKGKSPKSNCKDLTHFLTNNISTRQFLTRKMKKRLLLLEIYFNQMSRLRMKPMWVWIQGAWSTYIGFPTHTSSSHAEAQVRPEGKYSSIGSLVSFKRPLRFENLMNSVSFPVSWDGFLN